MTDRKTELRFMRRVEAHIHIMAKAAGDPKGCSSLDVTAPAGFNSIVVCSRDVADTGASISLMIRCDEESYQRDIRRLEVMVRRTLRATARNRAIADEATPPVWSMSTHALIAAAIRHAGADLHLLADESAEARTLLNLQLDGTPVSVSGLKVVAGHVEVDVLEVLGGSRMLLWTNATTNGLRLPGLLPDTILSSIVGLKVSDVIRHPAIDAAGDVRIVSAKNDTSGDPATVLVVEGCDVPLHPVPEGIDDAWLKIAY